MRQRPRLGSAEDLDQQLSNADHRRAFKPSMGDWIRSVRSAQGFTASDVAARMQISQPAVTKLERNEGSGSISINKLAEVAEALNCELVYGFVPKKSFMATAETVEKGQERARKAKRKMPRASDLI